jgi:peptidoglycan/LPS O-acetylase OafA/YrhL
MAEIKIELPAPVSGRLPVLDELKGLAIILVILYHAGGVLVWNNYLHGDIGVDMFVILSGLGLALGSHYRSAREFMTRRLLRILPPYWIVLTVFALGGNIFLQLHYTTANLLLHYLGIHAWFGDAYAVSINDSFWFITLILTLYVLFCAIRPLVEKPAQLLLVGSGISVAIAFVYFFWNQPAVFGHLGLRIPGFFVGLLLGQLLKSGRLLLPVGTSLAMALFVFVYVPYTQGIVFHPTVAGLAVMGFYSFAVRPALPQGPRLVTGRVLKFFGDHSLEIFLIHQPLIRDYNVYLHGRWFNIIQPSPLSLTVGMSIGLAVTLIASVELRRLLQKLPFHAKA